MRAFLPQEVCIWQVESHLAGWATDKREAGEVDARVHDGLAPGDEVLLHGSGEVQPTRVESHHLARWKDG